MVEKSAKEDKSQTRKEIFGQPDLWASTFDLLRQHERGFKKFIAPVLKVKNLQIILTGAGSSAFIGEAAQGLVQKHSCCSTKAIATTDLVTHHELYLQEEFPTLLVSFARSGNSPESIEAVNLANTFCKSIHHLVITCNAEGEFYRAAARDREKNYSILLPEAANDKSLAMTGSFTSMLLTVLLIFRKNRLVEYQDEVARLMQQGTCMLDNYTSFLDLSQMDFERVVFLGSGPMLGVARECHLKLQELTDGKVICKHDSFLGFRHGPRAVTNSKTLIIYLFSSDKHVYQYEKDLALSIAQDQRKITNVCVGRTGDGSFRSELKINLDLNQQDELYFIAATLAGQLLGLCKSSQLGLNPDNPSVSGSISRVVQGVTIYPNPKKKPNL